MSRAYRIPMTLTKRTTASSLPTNAIANILYIKNIVVTVPPLPNYDVGGYISKISLFHWQD